MPTTGPRPSPGKEGPRGVLLPVEAAPPPAAANDDAGGSGARARASGAAREPDGGASTPRPASAEGPREPAEPASSEATSTPRTRAVESAKPLLASEALIDDLAPLEPAKRAARFLCLALGLVFVLEGAGAIEVGQAAWQPGAMFALAAAALTAALLPASYLRRACTLAALGATTATLGLLGLGPARGMAVGGLAWGLLRFVAATLLPAALLFRSRYRAYAPARWILGACLAAALPFLGHAIALLLADDLGWGHVGAALAVTAVTASLSGFMGSETTGAASYTAFGAVAALAAELALEAVATGVPETVDGAARVAGATIGFVAATSAAAVGAFQMLSWRLAPDARRIDLHARAAKEADGPPTKEEWSTRG